MQIDKENIFWETPHWWEEDNISLISFSFKTYKEFFNHPFIQEKIKFHEDNFDKLYLMTRRGLKYNLPFFIMILTKEYYQGKTRDKLIGRTKYDIPELPTFYELFSLNKKNK